MSERKRYQRKAAPSGSLVHSADLASPRAEREDDDDIRMVNGRIVGHVCEAEVEGFARHRETTIQLRAHDSFSGMVGASS